MKDAVEPMEEGESVVRRYAPMVYRLALAQVRGRCDAEDIFQEVFLRYFRSAPVFSEEEHRRAWLIRVTVNCAKKFWTSAWMRRTVPLEEAEGLFRETEDTLLWDNTARCSICFIMNSFLSGKSGNCWGRSLLRCALS